jgi:DNA ligase-1
MAPRDEDEDDDDDLADDETDDEDGEEVDDDDIEAEERVADEETTRDDRHVKPRTPVVVVRDPTWAEEPTLVAPAGKTRPWWKTVPAGASAAPTPGAASSRVRAITQPTTVPVRAAGVAPPLLLAHSWDNITDLSGWWMSEKLDGVRAYWDGKSLISRLGNAFAAPKWFLDALPPVILDGELWGGRKRFQRTVSVVRRQDASDAWREITFVVFDAPHAPGSFEERIEAARAALVAANVPHARFHQHDLCRGLDHLREELARVESEGGEGLMMRRPGSRYEVGRSFTLLKVKTFHDAEGRVVSHLPGAGKHKGRLGALLLEMPDGTRFSVGTGFTDEERKSPPAVGAIVTYRYQELSDAGVPRFPSFIAIRDDLPWPPPPPTIPAPPPDLPAPSPSSSPAPLVPVAVPAPSSSCATRHFTRSGASLSISLDSRSWRIRVTHGDATIESRTAELATPAAAWREAERIVAERRAEGWVEVIEG